MSGTSKLLNIIKKTTDDVSLIKSSCSSYIPLVHSPITVVDSFSVITEAGPFKSLRSLFSRLS